MMFGSYQWGRRNQKQLQVGKPGFMSLTWKVPENVGTGHHVLWVIDSGHT
jgi:hypothetical protein